jgi:uncharacterized protein
MMALRNSKKTFGMKNHISLIIITILTLGSFSQNTAGQETTEEFTSTIKTRGRFVEGKGVELRFFPNRKAILETGFRNGFIVEQQTNSTGDFTEIARLQPFTDAQWTQAINSAEPESETQDLLDLAWEFLKTAITPSGGSFNFEEGISAMRQQRADEDFQYAIFVLSAIREAKVAEALALSYTDADVVSGNTYTYRVSTVASHHLYTVVPEQFSIVASADNNQYTNEVYVYEGDTELNFAWEENENLTGTFIERKAPGETEFTPLNDAPLYNLSGQRNYAEGRGSYSDKELMNYQLYTYRFYANTLFGERVMFAELEAMPRDRTPPEQPYLENPQHIAPREVQLTWQMNETPAEDLMGFAVGRSSTPEGNFELLHSALLAKDVRSFIDTSFVGGARNYYVVQAVDTAFNVSSSFPVSVTLIDTIPPIQPVFQSGRIDSLGVVTLTVIKNPERDLMGYRLFRANDPEHEFSVIFENFVDIDTLNHEIQLVFNDTVTLNSLTPYIYYRIKALDFNHNQSDFSDIMVIERPDTIPPTTPVFKRLVNRTNEIELHFALSESRDVVAHQLYRKTDMAEPWETYANLEDGQQQFIDSMAVQGTTYYYSLRALDNSGLYSDFAHPVFGKAYDDGVRPAVGGLALSYEDGTITLRWNYDAMNDNTFFVVFKSDAQGRMVSHKRSNTLNFSEPARGNAAIRYAVRVHTNDGGQSVLSEEVVYEP